jgi:hypothetical protein
MTASVLPRSAAERGVATARFVLQRAAESGSACAALVLGTTFDPRYAQDAPIFLRIQEWQDTGTKMPTSLDQTSPRSSLTL